MNKTIFSIGIELPGGIAKYFSLKSQKSLLDADVIVFMPHLGDYYSRSEHHQGKRHLSELDSFKVVEDEKHWRTEIASALQAGKTIFVFLKQPVEVIIDTGKNQQSGTKSRPVTVNYVASFNSYETIPMEISLTAGEGSSMVLGSDASLISSYWKEFSQYSIFECYLNQPLGKALLLTKAPQKPVAALVKAKGGGNVILLPVLRFEKA